MNDVDHTKTKVKSPQTNGICERFHKTVLQGKMCCGRTPWETLQDGRRLAAEKVIDNAA